MSDTVDQVKERLSIVDVVQPYVKLTRAGKYWKGLSPFNKEKTPSFFVSPDRGMYHCFSSGKGGDIFTFIQEMEGVDFKGALKILAEKAGVQLSYEKNADSDKELLYKALTAAKDLFVENLKVHEEAKKYLATRGLLEKTIEEWEVGYAPDEWRVLHTKLIEKGFTEAILEKAGLIKQQEKAENSMQSADTSASNRQLPTASFRYYDRFRGRIMFPIYDVSGRVVGFSGRILKDDEKHPQAKYLNSPETPVFDKSRALYGIHVAREGIRSLGAAILVEGQLDLLMSHQAGYKNTIATSGTAFTARHAELIRRYTPNLLIAYDGDRAGVAAAGRAAMIVLPMGMNVKVAKFPAGADPAELVLKTPEAYKASIKEAAHVVDFYLSYIEDAKYDSRTFRLEVSRTVLPYITMIENRIDQAHFVQKVAEALSVPESAVAEELKKLSKGNPSPENQHAALRPTTTAPAAEPFMSRTDSIERLVYGLMLVSENEGNAAEAGKAEAALTESVGTERLMAMRQDTDESRAALFEADFFLAGRSESERAQAIAGVYDDLSRASRHEKYREALSRLRLAEKENDHAQAGELLKELSVLARNLD